MARSSSDLRLAFGFEFSELYDREGLARLDAAFMEGLRNSALKTIRLVREEVNVARFHQVLDRYLRP